MPNWCQNKVQITGPNKKIKAMAEAIEDKNFLGHMNPMPACLEGTTADGSKDEQNIKKTGYSDWYGWCVDNWGTKWEVHSDYHDAEIQELHEQNEGESLLTWYFDSAWGPPLNAFQHYITENSDVSIYATYYEPGCDFMGIWENGHDDCYEVSQYDSKAKFWDTAEGRTLDDDYNIVESKAEWEEENLDEGTKKVMDYLDGQPQNLDQLKIGEEK